MAHPAPGLLREILACLLCSRLYFDLRPAERLALVKSLAAELEQPASGENA